MSRDDEGAALAQKQNEERRRIEDELLARDPGYSLFLAEVAAMNAIEQLLQVEKHSERQ